MLKINSQVSEILPKDQVFSQICYFFDDLAHFSMIIDNIFSRNCTLAARRLSSPWVSQILGIFRAFTKKTCDKKSSSWKVSGLPAFKIMLKNDEHSEKSPKLAARRLSWRGFFPEHYKSSKKSARVDCITLQQREIVIQIPNIIFARRAYCVGDL